MECLCRLCQLSIETALPPNQTGGTNLAAPLGSEPNAEPGAGRPQPRDLKGKEAGAPRERPAPELERRRGGGSREAAATRERSPVPSSWTGMDRVPHLPWRARAHRAALGRKSSSSQEGLSLGLREPPLASRRPDPFLPGFPQSRGRPCRPAASLPGWSAQGARSRGQCEVPWAPPSWEPGARRPRPRPPRPAPPHSLRLRSLLPAATASHKPCGGGCTRVPAAATQLEFQVSRRSVPWVPERGAGTP